MASCSTSPIYTGSRPVIQMTWRDADGDLADPNSISVRVLTPNMTTATYATPDGTITNESLGIWNFQFPVGLSQSGTYWVYMVGTGGGVDVASEIKLTVHGTHVPWP